MPCITTTRQPLLKSPAVLYVQKVSHCTETDQADNLIGLLSGFTITATSLWLLFINLLSPTIHCHCSLLTQQFTSRDMLLLLQSAQATTNSAARILPNDPSDGSLPPPNGVAAMDEDDDMGMPGPSSSSRAAPAAQGRTGSRPQTASESGRGSQNRQATLGEAFGRSGRSTQQVRPTALHRSIACVLFVSSVLHVGLCKSCAYACFIYQGLTQSAEQVEAPQQELDSRFATGGTQKQT